MKKIYLLIIALTFTVLGFGQTELVNETLRTGTIPAGWTQSSVTFSTGAGGYANFTSTASTLTSVTFDASSYNALEVHLSVAKFGTGGDGPITVEYSLNGGSTWSEAGDSSIPTDSDYINDVVTINNVSASMQVRFNRADSPSAKRLRDIIFFGVGATCPASSLPFEESFEDAVPPACWTQYPGTNGLGTVQQWVSDPGGRFGSNAAYIQWEIVADGQVAEDWLVTPAIDLTSSTNVELSFWSRDGFSTDYGSEYTIRVSTTSQTDINSFTTVETYSETEIGTTYNQKIVDLSSFSGNTVYVAFVMATNDGDGWYVDDVSIYDSTECVPPAQATAFFADAVDGDTGTATLNWTRGAGDNVLVVMRAGGAVNSDPSSGTAYTADSSFGNGTELGTGNFIVYNGSDSFVNITNLTPNTTYHVAIYEYTTAGSCYNTDELTGSFFMACGSGYGLPFAEGFENGGALPSCWATYRGENGLGIANDWEINSDDVNSGTFAAYVEYESGVGTPIEDWLVTPAITIPSDANAVLTFYSKDEFPAEDYGSEYTVRVSTTSQTDISSFTTVMTYTETELGSTYNQKSIDLSAYNNTTVYIAFVLTNDDGDSWFLDDVAIDSVPIGPQTVWIEDFDSGIPNWPNDIADQLFVDPSSSDEGLFIQTATANNANFSGNSAFGKDLAGESGEPTLDPYVFTFEDVSVSGYTSLQLSFDYHAFANADAGYYEVFLDGIGQTPVEYFNDPDLSPGVNGTIVVNIPDGTSTVGLQLTGTLNGASDVLELDNFMITGTPPAPTDFVYNNGWTPTDPSNGVSTQFDNIQIVAGTTTLTGETLSNNLTIDVGTELIVSPGSSVEVFGTLDNSGTLSMESTSTTYSSIIPNAVSGTGTFNYDRHVNINASVGENDLISAPLTDEDFGTFATRNTNIVEDPNDATRKLFGPFSKTLDAYQIYDTDDNAATPLVAGEGYRAASTDNGGFVFTGTLNTGVINRDIVFTSGDNFEEWNLIGNPYPSYINVNAFLTHEVSPGVSNIDLMLDANAAIYGYDGLASDGWIIYNLLTPIQTVITPGQGFFVTADPAMTAAHDLQFSPSMRSTGTTDDFIAGRSFENYHLKIQASTGNLTRKTDFYFTNFSTSGLDRGYDAAVFGNNANTFDIYSHLVTDNNGIDMAIQALLLSDLDSEIIVPLGINATQGQQVLISIAESDLPENVAVYLEDNVAGTFTLLNDGDFTFTATSTLNNTGRFYLRFTNSTLSNPTTELKGLQIYSTQTPKALFIEGQLQSDTKVSIYDIQGRLILSNSLDITKSLNQINVEDLNAGIYVVKLKNTDQQRTQKVIIR